MRIIEQNEDQQELSKKLHYLNKLIKYKNGLHSAPLGHRERIIKHIEDITKRLNIDDDTDLFALRDDLESSLEQLVDDESSIPYIDRISGWYLRPLINHFDNARKLESLCDADEGLADLAQKVQLFLPGPLFQSDERITMEQLQNYFRFKAHGKGLKQSQDLTTRFFSSFDISVQNPFREYAPDTIEVPMFAYNTSSFWKALRSGEPCMLVSGLCPMSTVADELGFELHDGTIIRPKLDFSGLVLDLNEETEKITKIIWPDRPIISDIVALKYIFGLFKKLKKYSNLSMQIWYPAHEYYIDLSKNILVEYLSAGIIEDIQLQSGLAGLKERYFKLIDLVRSELGLMGNVLGERIKIIDTDEVQYGLLVEHRSRLDLSFFKLIYGSWVGNELRHSMYKNLVIKHIQPALDGIHTLHLDNSYEIWPDILGASLLERGNQAGGSKDVLGSFSWISYPTLPSINLSKMREFNAPNNDKLYLSAKPELFKEQVDKLSPKYIQYIAPLLLDKMVIAGLEHAEIVTHTKNKLLEMNRVFNES